MGIFYRTFLKSLAILLALSSFVIFLGIIISFFDKKENYFQSNGDLNSDNKIGLIKLNGPILNEPSINFNIGLLDSINIIYVSEVEKLLKTLEIENVNGLIISINSPGGSVSASYKLYKIIDNFSKKNSIPIYFHTNELMASGAYWAALSGNKIFANYGSLIGSIGVSGPEWIFFDEPFSMSKGVFGNAIETKNGIKQFNNIAGKSKDLFNSFRAPTEKELNELKNITKRIYLDFIYSVEKNRKIESNIIINEIGAMIFDSKTAKEKFLIDQIASLQKTIMIMADDLSFNDYRIVEKKFQKNSFFSTLNLIKFNYFSNKQQLNDFKLSINKDICDISKYSLSVILLNTRFNSSC